MLRTALRNILAHKVRLALTIVTVTLGIAFVTGTNIFTDSLKSSFEALVAQPRPDLVVSPRTELDDQTAGETAFGAGVLTLPESTIADIAAVPGVAAAYGRVQVEGAYVLGEDGRPLGPQGPPARATTWLPDESVSSLRMATGRPPQGPGEIALLSTTATLAGKSVGDTVQITTETGVQEFEVVGTVTRTLSGGLGGTLVVLDLPAAQQAFLAPGEVTAVAVVADPGVSQDELAKRVAEVVPELTSITTAQQTEDQVSQRIEEGFGFLNTFLLAFGFIALFVSAFLIFNTFSMLVAQRTRELALLRAVGATRGQVFGSVLLEAGGIGAIAAALGLAGGVGVSLALRAIIERIGSALPSSAIVVEPSTFVLAAAVGIGVTLISAAVPAWRASVIPPVAAMREDATLPQRSLRVLTIAGAVLVLAAVPLVLASFGRAETDGQGAATFLGLAALCGLLGVIALTPAVSKPVLGAVAAPFRGRPVTQLAAENARRNPRRTAATASALAIGLALMTAVTVIGTSARASVTDVIDRTVGADFVVLSQDFRPFQPEVYRALEGTPGASVVTYVRNVPIEVDGERYPMTGIEPSAVKSVIDVDMTSGSIDALALGDAIVDEDTAKTLGLAAGDTLDATFVNGPGSVRIVGTFRPLGFLQGFIVTMPTLQSIGSLERDTGVYIKAAPGADLEALRAALTARLVDFPGVRLQDQADIKRDINSQFDLLFGFVYGLLALSIVVAFFGIVNTLSLSVYERIRELGLLRAVGMTRRQVRQMVTREALLIALLGTLAGLILGLVFGSLFQRILEPQGITVLEIPVPQLLVFAVLGAFGGLLAALWPAARASRLRILSAIATS